MTVAGFRHKRVAGEVQEEIATMLAGELKDPRLAVGIMVTEVRLSPDMKQARVYVNILGDEQEQAETLKGLAAATGFIRHELSVRLHLRRALDISFILDRSEQVGGRIEDLIRRNKNAE